ncbi:hypothetical protein JNUCC1_00152 [Lentibacillus sp. JNUCC-1]|uniref:Hsp20/alpha crystallin family protein n=1 Tax=Lentibacillus sp. JNUCC-1 TaxID=2654513 RepID=UPI00132448FF|nr:Hsp20/alpha crystallin family protein [Lentibacillus sp. JNUCC-1]MUV36350.1 hypothetical protein [Lentibacillus sp. JNUCC-1]
MKWKKDPFPNGFDVDLTPFREFMNRVDHVFQGSFKQMSSMFDLKPFWVDVEEKKDVFVITAYLEKIKQEQIHLEIIGHNLNIIVNTKTNHEVYNEEENMFEQKTNTHQMSRVVRLPFPIPRSKTKARLKAEQLVITIPKPTSEKITIEEDG